MPELTELKVEGISVAPIDIGIIVIYMVFILVAGVYVSRMASKNMDSYFLGGRRLPWWLLGLSGTACYFDVAGVMWTITLFYAMGQNFIWPQFMWGSVAMLACFAAFMGKWLRRSKVLTGAEWMVIRFGRGPAGEFARTAYALMAVVISVAFVGFAEFGCGQFLSTYIGPPEAASKAVVTFWPHILAVSLMALTAIYTISAGLIGVGLTGFIQFIIVLFGSTVLIVKAFGMSSTQFLTDQMPAEWFSIVPSWEWSRLGTWGDTAGWILFVPMVLTWVMKGVALGAGGPQQLYDLQRFLAAKTPREASLAGMIWGIGLTPLFMLSAAVSVIGIVEWGPHLSNPEMLYPMVIGTMLPVGLKGLVLAGLLSAFMSTFSATVNAGASYLAHDLYEKYIAPGASMKHLVLVSKLCSLIVIVAGILIGLQAKNINDILNWIMMVLGIGVLVPNVLRWFWWRFNGMGFAIGTLAGVAAAIVAVVYYAHVPEYQLIPCLLAISIVSSVAATFLSGPTEMEALKTFYHDVRPAGFWGPVKREVLADGGALPRDTFGWDLVTAVILTIGLQSLFLMSTYACTHQWDSFWNAGIVVLVVAVLTYFTWYKKLPAKDEDLQFELPPETT
jgi:SSS family solute:Na+ symporter